MYILEIHIVVGFTSLLKHTYEYVCGLLKSKRIQPILRLRLSGNAGAGRNRTPMQDSEDRPGNSMGNHRGEHR